MISMVSTTDLAEASEVGMEGEEGFEERVAGDGGAERTDEALGGGEREGEGVQSAVGSRVIGDGWL